MELKCKLQTYEWGKLGLESKAALLAKSGTPSIEIEPDTPYAELWMGTHPNGPSEDKKTGILLSSLIEKYPHYLGEPIRQLFGDKLPFLFKVLSVNKSLSIQAHPSKTHAEELYSTNPELYKDDNHKPEIAIALTSFEALCGFRPIAEIKNFVKNVRELRAVIGPDLCEQFILANPLESKEIFKQCFAKVMTCPQDEISMQLTQLIDKLSHLDENKCEEQLASLVQRLYSQYPNDVGCFAAYFLNHVKLEPFEALYLGPNEPHAYLSGDCVECMACSDNVVRAGLTPKYKDVDTLCKMLTYNNLPAEKQLFKAIEEDKYCKIFKPPVLDFAVAQIEIPVGETYYRLKIRNSASILLVIAGSGIFDSFALKPGVVLFIPANEKVDIKNVTQTLLLFQAMANI